MKTIFILLIAFLSIYASCNKDKGCREMDLAFEGSYKAYPDRDSIRIGDTIWLESKLPVQQKDIFSGEVVNFSGASSIGFAIPYLEFTGGNLNSPGASYVANYFSNVLIKGTESVSDRPAEVKNYRFVEDNGFYSFKLAIIPQKTGLFAIAPGNTGRQISTKDNKCWRASFNLTFKETNQHIYLYEKSRPGYIVSSYERGHMYVFKVY